MPRWRLIIEDDTGEKTTLPLHWDVYDVGRARDNEIRLGERNVSRWHARVTHHGRSFVLEDLQSAHGTYVNGARLTSPVVLHHGDIVGIGDYDLRVEAVDAPPNAIPGRR